MDCANLKTLFIIVVCVKARVCVCICIWMPRCMWRGQKATLLGCGLYLSLWYSPSTMWVLRNSGHQAWSHLLHHPAAPQIMPCLLCIIFLIHNYNSMVCILFMAFVNWTSLTLKNIKHLVQVWTVVGWIWSSVYISNRIIIQEAELHNCVTRAIIHLLRNGFSKEIFKLWKLCD